MTKGPVFCTICLTVRKRNEAWFRLVENRWTDRLKILSWHDELAFHPATHAVCCAAHVQLLGIHWMTTGTLNYPFARSEAWAEGSERPDPIPVSSMRDEPDITRTKVLAELSRSSGQHRPHSGRKSDFAGRHACRIKGCFT